MKVILILLVLFNIAWTKSLSESKNEHWKKFKVLSVNYTNQNFENDFNFSQLDFKKSYDTSHEELSRMEIFWKNLKTISLHNSKFRRGKSTFQMGVNKFSDMTFTEYSNRFKANETITEKSRKQAKHLSFEPEIIFYGFRENKIVNSSFDVPASFDWREKGGVTAVKDQKLCGSCYAMATIASVETQLFIKTGKQVQLSEQEILDCADGYGTNGCEGGISFRVYDYIKDNSGISSSLDYQYEAKASKCRKSGKKKVEIDVKGYGFVDDKDDEVLMEAVVKFGPIMISIDTDHESFMHYSSGIYYENKCTEDINHGAVLIGYGSEKGENFWIVKNSFGKKWGESGYVRIARGRGNDCGVNLVPLFPILNDPMDKK